MDVNEYQRLAGRTLIDKPDFFLTDNRLAISLWALELVATAGKVADLVKKGVYHQHGINWALVHEALAGVITAAGALMMSDDLESGLAPPSDTDVMLLWNALGIAGEAGEVVELAHRQVSQHDVTAYEFAKELGDLQWYLSASCTKLDISLSEVMQCNIEKLQHRYPEGYSSEASKTRAVED